MTIHISGQAPAKAQNGMYELEPEWTQEPTPDTVIAVVKIARSGYKFSDEKQQIEATMKFVHIEPLTGQMAEEARALLVAAAANRPDGDTQTELDIPKPENGPDSGDGSASGAGDEVSPGRLAQWSDEDDQ